MVILWSIVFIVSLGVLIKGSGLFIKSAEKIGVYLGMKPFVIGVLIVGVGTSLPELVSAFASVIAGATEIVTANAIGSNITNILLVVGILAIVGRKLVITKDLLASEIPLFVVSTALFLGVAYDGEITFIESVLLFSSYIIYLLYSLFGEEDISTVGEEKGKELRKRIWPELRVFIIFFVGLAGLLVGAKYLIDSVIHLSVLLNINSGLIAITAVALGTSLPELFVSLRALLQKKTELAIGNIFGSNAFNILMAVGIPGLFSTLYLDERTLTIGLPILAIVSAIFIINGISKRIYKWEGMMFLIFYIFFILKLFGV